ncbi:MAG: FapA family protein [Spirochaetales bacterium]|jgi:uncharacterized protein (DUF342 family)|nr:FapA family protein [Spirochaetales bacterium]
MAAKTTTLQGKLDVSVSEDGLEAVMSFTPLADSAASEIDMFFLSRLLQTKNIREGISPKDLETVFGRLKGAKEAFSLPVARGAAPQDPAAETPVWENIPIPPELEEESKKAFAAAGEPVIYGEKVENIKHEKIVLKKSPIPFAHPKKETVVEVEKKVTKIKIEIDPAVTGTGYAAEGAVIAQLQPFTAGKPGKSVTGALLPAKTLEAPYVYPGGSVQKKGGKLIALCAGFVRRGSNWAELLPFRSHSWKVYLSADKITCRLSMTPGDVVATVPTGETIRAAAIALPYDERLLLSAEDIYVIARELAAESKPSDAPLSLPVDGAAEIKVSDDKLEASLFLRKGRGGGKPLSLKDVGSLIQKSGLKGLNLKKIQTDIPAFQKSGDETLENYILAKGRAPAAGSPAAIQWEVKLTEGKALGELKKSMPPPAEGAEDSGPYAGIASLKDFPVNDVEMAAFVTENQSLLSLKPGKPGSPGMDVYGAVIPSAPGQESAVICRENVKQEQNIISAGIAGLLEARKNGAGFEIRVRPHMDGEVAVTVSPNAMEAFITVFPAHGTGRAITKEAVTQAVTAAGVVYKAQRQDVFEALVKKSAEGEAFTNVPFAKGQPPKDGTPPKLSILVETNSEKVTIRGDGKADYKNSHTIISVKKDETVAEILSPQTSSEDGWDVTGKPIAAKAAGSETVSVGKNVREEKKDGRTFLVAEVNGELQFDERSVSVLEGHVINGNVDMKTGNIKFPGSVFVNGFVDAGFFIMSGGDIKISQGVEAALLSAEGSITIDQGVKGMGKAVLRSKKDIGASFAEQAVIMCVGDIAIKNGCVRCNIKSNGKLTLSSDKGLLIGGVVKARRGIEAASLGNETGVQTEISFGQDYLLADQIETLEKTIQKLNKSCSSLNVLMREAEKSGDRKKLESCHTEKLTSMKQVEKMNHQLLTLREKFEEYFPAEILVRGTLYPGVVIESHGRYYETKQPRTKLKLTFDKESGKIVEI